ncbi:hypothetical protein DL96DRAFT_1809842 [Flagelloscypha sp. PMI_526]|nr:hypothetical protein DL96DRAFT_1809842 [Flagelloscypha sp. PMI_526]
MTSPPNAGFPIELWLNIISFLSNDDTYQLRHLNTTFWDVALDAKYSTLEITHNHPKGLIALLQFYSEPFVAPRVKCVRVEPKFVHSVTKRPAWVLVLEALIPLLHNVIKMVLYPIHRDKVTRRLLVLLVQSAPRLRQLWLDLCEDNFNSSAGMAREFSRKRISLPSLRDLRVIYHGYSCLVWQPVIRRMISQSSELERTRVHIFYQPPIITDEGKLFSIMPLNRSQLHPRLHSVRFTGSTPESPGVLQFLHEYRMQLLTLHLDYIPSQIIPSISELHVLSSLWVKTVTPALYSELLTVINGLGSLRELHIAPRGVEFTVHDAQTTFPPIPFLPLLEKFSVETPIFDLSYLHCFVPNLPALRCLTTSLTFASPLAENCPRLECGPREILEYRTIHSMQNSNYDASLTSSFRTAILELESIHSWKLEMLYIHLLSNSPLSDDVVDCFPKLIPSLTSKQHFYQDWRGQMPRNRKEFIPYD